MNKRINNQLSVSKERGGQKTKQFFIYYKQNEANYGVDVSICTKMLQFL